MWDMIFVSLQQISANASLAKGAITTLSQIIFARTWAANIAAFIEK